jgi:hypothetical protein
VIVNNATRDADYEIELFRGDGSSLGSFTTTLGYWEYAQIDRVFERVTDERIDGGYAIVRPISPWGHFHAQASVVDNRTGDPITVDAIPLRLPETAGVVETVNVLYDALSDGSLPMRATLLSLVDGGADALLDAIAAAAPDRATRTAEGIMYDNGLGSLSAGGTIVGGRVELEVADDFQSGSGQASGGFSIAFDGFHVDGVAPAIGSIQGSLDIQRTDGDHVSGTITLGAPGVEASIVSGNLQVNTGICDNLPVGGEVIIEIDGIEYVININELCNGSFQSNVPSGTYWRYEMRVRNCDGSWKDQWDTIFLINDRGRLTVDPGAPAPYGRQTWTVRGDLPENAPHVELHFLRTPSRSPDNHGRLGAFRGGRNEPAPGTIYYTGLYGYDVWTSECSTKRYYHSRSDPDFSAAILQPCDGPCTP